MPRPAANIHITAQQLKGHASSIELAAAAENHGETASLVTAVVVDLEGIIRNLQVIEPGLVDGLRKRIAEAMRLEGVETDKFIDRVTPTAERVGEVGTSPPPPAGKAAKHAERKDESPGGSASVPDRQAPQGE